MSEEDRKKEIGKESGEISRRQFLTGAGLVVGGGAVGALIAWPLIPGEETIVEVPGDTIEVDKFIDPYDGTELNSYAELVAHVAAEHADEAVAPEGQVTLNVNGVDNLVKVEDNWTLAYVIREKLGLTGTKRGCDSGNSCGVCTVQIDGRPALSCIVLAVEAEGKAILTIEGLRTSSSELHPIQQAFIDKDALQCGFCTPGQIMNAKALLEFNPNPTEAEVRNWMSGVLCRCGSYQNMREAVLAAASM
jgi:aerobic-type carbon monoxide dehydrogenase small subunit (CoxS/CutS family)